MILYEQKTVELTRNGSLIVQFKIIFRIIVTQPEPDKPAVPEIKLDISMIIKVLNSTSSKSILSITSILEVELVTVGTTAAPPQTTGMYL
uniref:Uncharacterized protein n=1 Tax=Octopus bimaculoides TaxID=37653 RepID=A0A0L8GSK0_OCTBM